jgi:hypothetical protein
MNKDIVERINNLSEDQKTDIATAVILFLLNPEKNGIHDQLLLLSASLK